LPVSDNLPDDPETLKAMLLAERHESERLRQIIKELQRHRFGRKAESLPEEQMLLGLEDVEQVAAFAVPIACPGQPSLRAKQEPRRRTMRLAGDARTGRGQGLTVTPLVPRHSDYDSLGVAG
jgi:transposase